MAEPFQEMILTWYEEHGRDLPWRKTTDPYSILVSETMLQQTQVDRVIPKYNKWLEVFPTTQALADAEKTDVMELWMGLGYNSRALRLQQAAAIIAKNGFPQTEKGLTALPGVGPYTARAVLAFAFNKDVPVLDTNIRRIYIHELRLPEGISQKELELIAQENIPKGQSRIWHNALMDYGALVLTARKTGIKPLKKQSRFRGSTRETRAKILRYLLKEKKESYASLKMAFPHEKFDAILEKMEKEELIIDEKGSILLKL
ncbi:MAG: Fe-S cluster assembly protein HesB [Nanoarchaeota archaeon]